MLVVEITILARLLLLGGIIVSKLAVNPTLSTHAYQFSFVGKLILYGVLLVNCVRVFSGYE